LLKAGAPVNGSTGYDRVTPLMCAVSSRSYETVEVLLEHGADVAAKNVNGSTALHVGIARDVSLETIRPLLRSGANAQIETNEFGYTPLRVAHERGREEIVQLLRESQKAKSE
jgi:ankyrin repeat protein